MTSPFTPKPEDLLDRELIRECIYRYARGIDRCDEELLRSAYWPDARAYQLDFSGTRDEFVTWAITSLQAMDTSMHLVGNILLQIHGERASGETYFHGLQGMTIAGTARESVMGGRYVDRFEKRNGEWRIIERNVIVDWFRDYPDASNWSVGPFGMGYMRGGRTPQDKSCEIFTDAK